MSAAAASAVTAYVGLGANLGDARASVCAAAQALGLLPGTVLLGVSSLYRSAPVDAGGPDFINAVAQLSTTLAPAALLHALHAIEREHGRERPYLNAPRTLDLDLLLHGESASQDARLTLPHPRLHQRAFVLLPLLELAPALQAPGLGRLSDFLPGVADQRIQPAGRCQD
jgi:2-amino-4-hydroxy-6-hydroxymethyldihydropteridine diphosphokinase